MVSLVHPTLPPSPGASPQPLDIVHSRQVLQNRRGLFLNLGQREVLVELDVAMRDCALRPEQQLVRACCVAPQIPKAEDVPRRILAEVDVLKQSLAALLPRRSGGNYGLIEPISQSIICMMSMSKAYSL